MVGTLLLAAQITGAPVTRPDFSGRWVPVVDPGSDPERVRVVKHDATTITVWDWADGGIPRIYNLDGSERAATLDGMPATSTVRWKFGRLIVESRVGEAGKRRSNQVTERTEEWSLDARGFLRIEIHERRSGFSLSRIPLVYRREPDTADIKRAG